MNTTEIQRIHKDVEAVSTPLLKRIQSLQISGPDEYAIADSLLLRVHEARKVVKDRLAKVIDPAKEAKDAATRTWQAAKALWEEMDGPLLEGETKLRDSMKQAKLRELAEQRQIQEARDAEERRILAEAENKRLQEAKAKTEAMRARLARQREELEAQAADVSTTPIATPVRVAHSFSRTVKKWRVTNFASLVSAVEHGRVPLQALIVNDDVLNETLKNNQPELEKWPGIEVYDDVVIARRG